MLKRYATILTHHLTHVKLKRQTLGVPILLAVVVSREGEAPPHAVQNILPGVRSMEPMGREVEFWRILASWPSIC